MTLSIQPLLPPPPTVNKFDDYIVLQCCHYIITLDCRFFDAVLHENNDEIHCLQFTSIVLELWLKLALQWFTGSEERSILSLEVAEHS